jgi:hypothetical protein
VLAGNQAPVGPKTGNERAALKPPPDLLWRHPLPQQAFPRHDSMGATGNPRDLFIDSPGLLFHMNT